MAVAGACTVFTVSWALEQGLLTGREGYRVSGWRQALNYFWELRRCFLFFFFPIKVNLGVRATAEEAGFLSAGV